MKTFATGGTLNAPWAVAAPATVGTFSNSILVGNFGDGTINAFDSTGKFLGQVSDTNGKPIVNLGCGIWFSGQGARAIRTTLYFAAGGSNQTSGLFAIACGGSSSSSHQLSPNTVTVKLTGVSGGISHSVPVQLTIQ